MGRRAARNADEHDLTCRGCRHNLTCMNRPGYAAGIKARANRRERRTVNVWYGWA